MPKPTRLVVSFGLTLIFVIPPLALGAVGSKQSVTPLGFRWIDRKHDGALWNKIQMSFRDELKPDKPDPDTLTYGYKYLKRVGVSSNSALVIVGYRTREHPTREEQGSERFMAFNLDLSAGTFSKVTDPESGDDLYMWDWRFITLTRFEPTPAPDVVFTYLTCWECEEETMLAALRFNPATGKWQMRRWGDGKPEWWMTAVGLVVAMDVSFTGALSYKCLYGLSDLTGDGFDDVAIRCREVDQDDQKKISVTDSTVLYSLKGGSFTGELVLAKARRLEIWSNLCRNSSENRLCRGVERSNASRPQVNAAP